MSQRENKTPEKCIAISSIGEYTDSCKCFESFGIILKGEDKIYMLSDSTACQEQWIKALAAQKDLSGISGIPAGFQQCLQIANVILW